MRQYTEVGQRVYLDGGGGDLPGLVKVQRHHVGEAAGVVVQAGGGVAKGLQGRVHRLPLLRCREPELGETPNPVLEERPPVQR